MRDKYNNGKWTKGRFDSFITSILRGGSRRWEPKWAVLREAATEKKVNTKTGRIAQHYECATCQEDFPAKDVQVDHVIAMGPGLTWDEFIDRLFCEKDNLQVLCKPCHAKKTKKEKELNEDFKRRAPPRRNRKV
ncbi:MAG TPA: HNH endonuclease signature motif containing protein [Anaerolineales bacterium]|nr:HNH endonuclease signature motif containing protein [Anaerolineales bacterium]